MRIGRHIWLLVLAGLLLVACGRQDRYLMVPENPVGVESVFEGVWETTSAVATWADSELGILVVGPNDFLLLDDTKIIRYQDGLLRNMDSGFGVSDRLVGVVQDHLGTFWAVSSSGEVYSSVGDQWELEIDISLGGSVARGLVLSDNGEPAFYGGHGSFWQRSSGQWAPDHIETEADILKAWVHPETGLWAVDQDLQLYHRQVDGWVADAPFNVSMDDYWSSFPDIQIDEFGNTVFYMVMSPYFWILTAEGWQLPASVSGTDRRNSFLFWQDEQLYSQDRGGETIDVWQDGQWHPVCDNGLLSNIVCTPVCAFDKAYFYSHDCLVISYEATVQTVEIPRLGAIAGVAELDDQLHVVVSSGHHLIEEPNGWRIEGEPLDGGVYYSVESPLVDIDDLGDLVFLSSDEIIKWDGNQYIPILEHTCCMNYYGLNDGSFLVERSGAIGLLKNATFEWTGNLNPQWDDPDCFISDAQNNIWAIDRDGSGSYLTYTHGDLVDCMLVGPSYSCLAYDPVHGVLVGGPGVVLVGGIEGFVNITPHVMKETDAQPTPVECHAINLDSEGRWLIYDEASREVVRGDHEGFKLLMPSNREVFEAVRPYDTTITPLDGGDFLLWNRWNVLRYRADGGGS